MTKWDKALTVAVLLAAALSFFAVPKAVVARGGAVVEITAGGKAAHWAQLRGNTFIDIAGSGGRCRLEIRSERARVVDADCPKRLCLEQGWIEGSGQSIICLPHRVVISIAPTRARARIVDAVVR